MNAFSDHCPPRLVWGSREGEGASSPVGQASFSSQSQASGPSQFQKGTASPWYLMKKGVYIAAQVAILSVFRGRGSPL